MATRWTEKPHDRYGEGLYRVTSHMDPKFPEGALFSATNIVYDKDSDDPKTMDGSTQLGTVSMGGAVSGLFDYNNGDKLVASSEDGKFWQYGSNWAVCSGARAASGNSTSAGVRWSGDMFYGAVTAKNLLILGNGVNAPVRYDTTNGAVALGGTPPALGKYPVAWQNRLWLFQGDTAHYSAVDNCEDWTALGGGGSIAIYRGHDGDITGAVAYGNNLFIFKRSSTYMIGKGAISTSSVQNVDMGVGCVSHHTIQRVGGSDANKCLWWSEHGIEAITPSDVSTGFRTDAGAWWVQPLLDRRNGAEMAKAWALFNAKRMEYFTSYPAGSGTIPKESMIGNFGRKNKPARWTTCDKLNLTAGVTFNTDNTGYDQYVGDSSGKVYLMHVPTADDWSGVTFRKVLQTKFYNQNAPHRMKIYGWSQVRASGKPGEVTVRQRLLRQNMPGLGVQNDTTLSASADGWGVGKWGVAEWGGSGTAGQRIRPVNGRRGFGMSHVITTNSQFTLSGLTVASSMRSNKPV